MNLCKSFLSVVSVALFAAPLMAATYYVSPAGNDAYTGTASTTPWKTVAHVNGVRFNSGDSVLFLAGSTWREELISTQTGVTFGAYGTGARPVISGANLYTTGWTSSKASIWTVLVGEYEPEQVWFNGVLGQAVATAAAVIAPNQWFFSSTGYLTVYSAATPNTASTTVGIEAAQRDSAFAITGGGNITVSGLAFVNPNYTAVNIASNVIGTQTFTNCLWRGAQYEGLVAAGGTEVVTNSEGLYNEMGISVAGGGGISLNNSILSGNTDGAIELYGTTAASKVTSSTLTGNGTPNPLSPVIQNYDSFPLTLSKSIYLPNPVYSIESTYAGVTDDGTNANVSPAFQQRAAPFIVVPFIDDYNNLAVAQQVSALAHQNSCTLSYALNTKLVTAADWTKISALVTAGDEIVAHTRSHSDLANTKVVTIQYTGAATTAKMTIANGVSLKTFLNNSTTADLSVDLSNTYNGMIDICKIVNAKAGYSCVPLTNQNYFTPALLAGVTNVNIKTAYIASAASNYLTWEIPGAIADIQANIAGYTVKSFATPFTSSSAAVETAIQNAGVLANRNGLLDPNNLPNGNYILSGPFDVYNFASMWLPSAFDATQPTSSTAALMEGLGATGAAMALFSHGTDEFSIAQWQTLFQNLHSMGATCMTMSQAIQYVKTNGTLIPDGTSKNWVHPVVLAPNFTTTSASPTQGAHGLQ